MDDYQTYEEFMQGRKPKGPKRLKSLAPKRVTKDVWNLAVLDGKVTSHWEQAKQIWLENFKHQDFNYNLFPLKKILKFIKRGYL